jgi:adenylate cyclase
VEGRAQGLVLVAEDLTEARIAAEGRAREAAEKERVRALFGHYVAPSVVEHLMEQAARGQVQLGGTRQTVSILFADIRGFTTIAESLAPPEAVLNLLNRYLGVATEAIIKDDGTLDKYMGDAVMAFFNAPLPQTDHVLRAVRAAAAMQRAVQAAQQVGGPPVGFGVGVNTGDAIVGNIGTEQLMNYTVVGDAVNVAARLQSVARAGEVLLSGATYEQVKERVDAESLPPIEVKGRRQPVAVYRLRDVR